MKPVVDGLGQRYSGRLDWYAYADLDSDAQASSFADAHGVRAVPTMVLTAADGREIKRWVGGQPESELVAAFDAALSGAR